MPAAFQKFLDVWEMEHNNTMKLLKALPADKYDFRPDATGRSIGELAWHLAEGDVYMSTTAAQGEFRMDTKPANIERPKTIEGIVEKFPVVYSESVARVKSLSADKLATGIITFPNGMKFPMMDFLWSMIIHHTIHHRGQLSLMARLAGAQVPGMYGPNREEMAAMRAAAGK